MPSHDKMRSFQYRIKDKNETIDEVTFYAESAKEATTNASRWAKRIYGRHVKIVRRRTS